MQRMFAFIFTILAAMVCIGGAGVAQDAPKLPTPVKEHAWLDRFVGEWTTEAECELEPGKPKVKYVGKETTKSLGGFFIVIEGDSDLGDVKSKSFLTLGYDAKKKKYVGTWVDSCTGHLWTYEGEVDASGEKLDLYTEGPSMIEPGKTAKYKESTEFKSKDHRVFTSSIQGADGAWTQMLSIEAKRKK